MILLGWFGGLEHLAPLMELLLEDSSGDYLGLVLGDQRGGEVAVEGVFHDLLVLAAAEQDADAGVLVGALAVAVERFQIEGQLAHVLRLEAACLQLEGDETLQVAMEEEEIELEVLIADLHAHLLADEGKAVAQLHEELAKIAQQ